MDRRGITGPAIFETIHRQSALNLFGYYDLHRDLDEDRLQLFLTLPILDHCGLPCCMHHEDTGPEIVRCRRVLKDTHKLCNAFQRLLLTTGDPLLKDDDPELVKELTTFILNACCEEHETKSNDAEWLAERLSDNLVLWRRKHLFNDPSPIEDPDNPENANEQQSSRFSKFFTAGAMGSLRRNAAKRRDQSASPPERDPSPIFKQPPQQMIRPMASANNMKHARKISQAGRVPWEATDLERIDSANRGSERKRDLLGLSSMVMTKIAAKN